MSIGAYRAPFCSLGAVGSMLRLHRVTHVVLRGPSGQDWHLSPRITSISRFSVCHRSPFDPCRIIRLQLLADPGRPRIASMPCWCHAQGNSPVPSAWALSACLLSHPYGSGMHMPCPGQRRCAPHDLHTAGVPHWHGGAHAGSRGKPHQAQAIPYC